MAAINTISRLKISSCPCSLCRPADSISFQLTYVILLLYSPLDWEDSWTVSLALWLIYTRAVSWGSTSSTNVTHSGSVLSSAAVRCFEVKLWCPSVEEQVSMGKEMTEGFSIISFSVVVYKYIKGFSLKSIDLEFLQYYHLSKLIDRILWWGWGSLDEGKAVDILEWPPKWFFVT